MNTIGNVIIGVVGLIAFVLFFNLFKNIGKEKQDIEVVEKKVNPVVKVEDKKKVDDEELIAVIAASIAASLGVSVPEINIKSIRRIPQRTPIWAQAGRQELTYRKLQ
ncbi:MAG: hypothetical protein GX300_03130 [Tissierellia bacterium]|nr:hypothetical protein [Tissierellia bacterium]